MIGLACAICGGVGAWLLTTAHAAAQLVSRRQSATRQPATRQASTRHPAALLASLRACRGSPQRLLLGTLSAAAAGVTGWTTAQTLFGGFAAPALVAVVGAAMPRRAAAARRQWQAARSRQAWPGLLAEIRIGVAHRNQSIPAALFAAGAQAPAEWREAFEQAARAWALSTDFEASLRLLKNSLADSTADAICETLLAAHEIGGVRLEARLRGLAEAAHAEAAARSDARSKQAGARFARSFVALVPGFMAVIGLSIGRGQQAYQTSEGQLLVVFSVLAVIGCWLWAGRIMAIPQRTRVFVQ